MTQASARSDAETALDAALDLLRLAEAPPAGSPDPAAQEGALRAYHAVLAAQELFVPLDPPAPGMAAPAGADSFAPRVLALASGMVVPAFDTEARLAQMLPGGAEFVALRGRDLVQALADAGGLGLGLNLATPRAAYLVPPEAVGWLGALTAPPPPPLMPPAALRGVQPHPPVGVPGLLAGLITLCLGRWPGCAQAALLAQIRPEGGVDLPLLALIAPPEPCPPLLLQELAEAARLASQGGPAGGLAVVALPAGDPIGAHLRLRARALPVPPAPPAPKVMPAAPPGSDPARPPRLK